MRMAGLTWNRRNPFADGAAEDGGLSRLGRALVDELVGLGVILDLAHASPATFDEIIARAGGAPVICTHAACRVGQRPPTQPDRRPAARPRRGGRPLRPDAAPARDRPRAANARSRRRSPRARGRRDRDRSRVPRRRLHDAAERGAAADARARRRADAGRPQGRARGSKGSRGRRTTPRSSPRSPAGAGAMPTSPPSRARNLLGLPPPLPAGRVTRGEQRQSAAPPSASSVAPFT